MEAHTASVFISESPLISLVLISIVIILFDGTTDFVTDLGIYLIFSTILEISDTSPLI